MVRIGERKKGFRMKESPILLNTEMVKAVLESRKTVTRRPINKKFIFNENPDKYFVFHSGFCDTDTPGVEENGYYVQFADGSKNDPGFYDLIKCPYGDLLWVRESAKIENYFYLNNSEPPFITYKFFDGKVGNIQLPERFSKHGGDRPKWVSKLQKVRLPHCGRRFS